MFGYYIEIPQRKKVATPSNDEVDTPQGESNLEMLSTLPADWVHLQTHPKSLRFRSAQLRALEVQVNDKASAALEMEQAILNKYVHCFDKLDLKTFSGQDERNRFSSIPLF